MSSHKYPGPYYAIVFRQSKVTYDGTERGVQSIDSEIYGRNFTMRA